MRIIRLAAATAALAIAAGTAQAQEWTTVRIGVDATYPPFEFTGPDGTIQGFSIEIANALCERMQVTCEYQNQDWEGIIPALHGEQVRCDRLVDVDHGRAQGADRFHRISTTIRRQRSPSRSTSKYRGLRQKTSPAPPSARRSRRPTPTTWRRCSPTSELRTYPTPDEYKLDLANGRLDAAVDDVTVLSDWLKTPDGACCRLVGIVHERPGNPRAGRRHRHSQGGHRRSATCSTGAEGNPRRRHLQGDQRQILRLRRLRQLIAPQADHKARRSPDRRAFHKRAGTVANP